MTNPTHVHPEAVEPARTPLVSPKRAGGRSGNVLLAIAATIAVGGLAFAGGRLTAAGSGAAGLTAGGSQPQGPSASGAPGAGMGSMTLSGTVASIDGSTMTLTTSDGSSVTLDLSSSTYHAQNDATAAEVTAGDTVSVTVSGGAGPGASADAGGTVALTASDVTIAGD